MSAPTLRCVALALGLGVLATGAARGAEGALHVASPDWRDQIIYFAMIDRFDDGDPRNNDQGAGEYRPDSGAHYSGGDLAGLTRRLDYIQGLGATALWITPPVAHQWWDGSVGYGGYHGYWGADFSAIDPHFGALADYQRLSRALHGRGMYLVQDIVVNHVGNWFGYRDGHDPRDPARFHWRNPQAGPGAAPAQWPFSLNDARDPAQRAADIYHWTPDIADFSDPAQERGFQLAGLDDLNTENPIVRRALRASYGHWIRDAGVDAFRIDTAFYVPPDFFRDFLQADDARAPGVLRVAAATGRQGFHVFGEGFGIDAPLADAQARKIETWARDAQGPLLPAMINFPLYGSTLDVFARGRPPAVLAHRIQRMMAIHADPHRMPSFVDNHDVDRFLAGGTEAALRQALLLIHTLPGIPVIYYGTEQGYTRQRAAMFARGYGAGGRDHFDVQAPLYRYLQRLAALRRGHRLLSRGIPTVLEANAAAPGVLLYAVREGDAVALVALNSAAHPSLAAAVATGLAPGTRLRPVFSITGDEDADEPRVDASGRVTLALDAHAGQVWLARPPPPGDDVAHAAMPVAPTMDPLPAAPVTDVLSLSGRARAGEVLQLVVDGRLDEATTMQADASGRWRVQRRTDDFVDPSVEHRVQAWSAATQAASAPQVFQVARQWRPVATLVDPPGDDHGRDGGLSYPTAPDFLAHRTADLRRIELAQSGGALRITVGLAELISRWNAPNGFDHVALTIFIELPGADTGARVMPLQHGELPDGMRWQRRVRIGGWNHALFDAHGAGADSEGRPLLPAPALQVEREAGRLVLTLPASALDAGAGLAGARVYVTSWDYDGGYRALAPQAAAFTFGGGDPARAARVMDDALLRID